MKKVILIFLQKVFVANQGKEVWQFSSKERKPVSLFGDKVGGVTFSEFIPGATATTLASSIWSAFLNQYDDTIASQRIQANGSNRFYLVIDEQGNQSVVTEDEGLDLSKEQMQSTTQQPQVVAE